VTVITVILILSKPCESMRGIYLEKLENIVLMEKDSEMVEVNNHLPQVAYHH